MKRLIGIALIVLVFVLIFALYAISLGIVNALLVFLFALVLAGILVLGAYLAVG